MSEPNKAEAVASAAVGAGVLAILFGPCCLKFGLIVFVILIGLKYLFS